MELGNLSFEQALERLQSIIQTLEQGGLTLDASIEQFELGTKLSNLCAAKLDHAEIKVSRLLASEVEAGNN